MVGSPAVAQHERVVDPSAARLEVTVASKRKASSVALRRSIELTSKSPRAATYCVK